MDNERFVLETQDNGFCGDIHCSGHKSLYIVDKKSGDKLKVDTMSNYRDLLAILNYMDRCSISG